MNHAQSLLYTAYRSRLMSQAEPMSESVQAQRDHWIAEAQARGQVIAELRVALGNLCVLVSETHSESEGHYPIADHRCPDCTMGTTPHNKQCAYHRATDLLATVAK